MNILVTGANGQLAQCIKRIVFEHGNGHPDSYVGEKDYWIFANRETLDITKLDDVVDFVKKNYINVIVNCAAYTNVAKAEDDTYNAYSVNVCGSENLAYASKKNGAVLIHISTDYVFDGKKGTPYQVDDETNPINAYGKTKCDGDKLIVQQGGRYLIFRTSWLYSQYGKNFVKTIAGKCIGGESCTVVNDQFGCPTNANDLARFIYRIITENNADNRYLSKSGIYHYCNSGEATWYDFARAIYDKIGDKVDKVQPTKTTNSGVERPMYSVMDTSLTSEIFNEEFKSWEDSLSEVINEILTEVISQIKA